MLLEVGNQGVVRTNQNIQFAFLNLAENFDALFSVVKLDLQDILLFLVNKFVDFCAKMEKPKEQNDEKEINMCERNKTDRTYLSSSWT